MNTTQFIFTRRHALLLSLTWLWISAGSALAHKPSDSYLTLHVVGANVTGEWHLALRDLEDAVGLDSNQDGNITWQEVRLAEPVIRAYAVGHLNLTDPGTSESLRVTELLIDRHSDGAYAVLRLAWRGSVKATVLTVRYQALFDIDPSHRGLLRLHNGPSTHLVVFGPDCTSRTFDLGAPPSSPPLEFLREGIWHIWTGYDHLLFLVALLLPGVLIHQNSGWQPQLSVQSVVEDVLKTVSAFTVAHSLTLTLAAMGWVRLPPRFVESVIATSIVVAAANNVRPFFSGRAWLIAFGFGLIHGFGFATALSDLGLEGLRIVPALLGFNLGVECGQLAVVLIFLPAGLLARESSFYRHRLLPFGSLAIAALATTWLIERAFDTRWLPF